MANNDDSFYHVFPKGFIWGMANSAYQTEGGWKADGKGESIWDRFCHEDASRIKDSSNGDVAMDSYTKYKEDVKLLKDMNAKMYRFSISWPRVLPKGTSELVNEAGIDYYNRLIDELLANGIEPCVTLFHWDLPQPLQEMNGWLNEELVQFFAGLNYYTAELVTTIKAGEEANCPTNTPGWNRDLGLDRIRDPNGKLCGVWWQRDVPTGLRNTLNWIKKQYGNPPVIITENGRAESDDRLEDDDRIAYFRGHINETLKAVLLDSCDVQGYLGWCLLDVFEWSDGYTVGFGVHRVDRTSQEKTRTPKKSAKYLAQIFKENGFPDKQ